MARRLLSVLVVTSVVSVLVCSSAWAAVSPEALGSRSDFPVTGFQIFIAVIIAPVLVGGGLLLRRMSRSKER